MRDNYFKNISSQSRIRNLCTNVEGKNESYHCLRQVTKRQIVLCTRIYITAAID